MENSQKPPLNQLVKKWIETNGVEKRSRAGAPYWVFSYSEQYDQFLNLFDTILNYGYEKKDIFATSFRTMVIQELLPDFVTFPTKSGLREAREKKVRLFDKALLKYSDITIINKDRSSVNETPKDKKPTPEELLDPENLNPPDRIIADPSLVTETLYDEEWLADMGVDVDSLEGTTNE